MLSRRGFLQGLAIATGAAIGSRIPGASLIGTARAATEPSTLVMVHMFGGYNAIFASADSMVGLFGISAGEVTRVGTSALMVDNTFAPLVTAAATNGAGMASIGVRHGLSSHGAANMHMWSDAAGANAGLVLANAMGGDGTIKAAIAGANPIRLFPKGAVSGVAFEGITDLQATSDAFGGASTDPRVPARAIETAGVDAARAMSANALAGSPSSLATLGTGYDAAVATLKKPITLPKIADLKTAYGLGASNAVGVGFGSRLAAAELMVHAGSNVVMVADGVGPGDFWDFHNDPQGISTRNRMTAKLPPLVTFVKRMVAKPGRNVVVCIIAEFARRPDSSHDTVLSATVIGKHVKNGTTGKVDKSVGLPAGTPAGPGLWSYLAAVTKTPGNPFGPTEHASLVAP
jgi:hypothetical protein